MKKLLVIISLYQMMCHAQLLCEQQENQTTHQEVDDNFNLPDDFDIYRVAALEEDGLVEFKSPSSFTVFFRKIGLYLMLRFFAIKDQCTESCKECIERLKELYARPT